MLEYSLFDKKAPKDQAQALAQRGIQLAQRQHKTWQVTLYSLDNYYVETWARHGLEIMTTFRKPEAALEIMEPYLTGLTAPSLP
ncbi:hypothetical protein [Rufibacter sp. LB8]|uniref:hypothetical protein n=1 Tax=Rufibacter sp. LB8 TaxID=2777781 RepID=UPI00178C712B|nr:hypothetical protein [Rufibacter sp. LB8]